MGTAYKHSLEEQAESPLMLNCILFISNFLSHPLALSPRLSPQIYEFRKIKCVFNAITLYSSLCLEDHFSYLYSKSSLPSSSTLRLRSSQFLSLPRSHFTAPLLGCLGILRAPLCNHLSCLD